MNIVIIDYGLCNLLSVFNAFKSLGIDTQVSYDPRALPGADAVILPGVGAFEDGMTGLRQRGFLEAIREYVKLGRPLLGICLGMQLLMERSFEFGEHEGLGLIGGDVRSVEKVSSNGEMLKIPHIGWNALKKAERPWEGTLLAGLPQDTEMYFVHSFRVCPKDPAHVLAEADYGGNNFCSVVQKGNIMGCQFHPEKSATMGLRILDNFVRYAHSLQETRA